MRTPLRVVFPFFYYFLCRKQRFYLCDFRHLSVRCAVAILLFVSPDTTVSKICAKTAQKPPRDTGEIPTIPLQKRI